ncbi:Golgi apparatus membrane protein TVP23 homolog B [Coccomyxa sp. Obi]|nr:Golgi apparatus membrane protein TVP23 homolog B [Coccomyxa sp. Obi]
MHHRVYARKTDKWCALALSIVIHITWHSVAAIVVYIICGLFSSSFVTNYVIVVVLLMLDFWTTKNVAGRLLVGLRWWNEVTDEGSNWRFETLEEGQRAINGKDSACFWWTLYVVPVIWLLLGIVAIVRLKIDYLLVVVVAVVLSGANVVGYTKCSKQASAQLKSYAQQAVTSGLTAAISRV